MLQTENLKYQYTDGPLIAFPDLSVKAGESLLILGESGCGKTTLLHLLGGLKKPSTGQVVINGEPTSHLSATQLDKFRGDNIGFVFQQSFFIQSLSVWDNIMISPYSQSVNKASELVRRLGISEMTKRYPHQLSVGQQQRASIARAVINQPKLILADEPTSALDNKNCALVVELLLEEAALHNAALVLVSHDERLKSELSECITLQPLVPLS